MSLKPFALALSNLLGTILSVRSIESKAMVAQHFLFLLLWLQNVTMPLAFPPRHSKSLPFIIF